jgi:hypothetical protein
VAAQPQILAPPFDEDAVVRFRGDAEHGSLILRRDVGSELTGLLEEPLPGLDFGFD